jgi:group I intron endonuclease
MEEKLFNFVYITINLLNGKKYVGEHASNNLNSYYTKNYKGSGIYFENAIKKHGKEFFSREILEFFPTKQEAYNSQEKYINEYNSLYPHGYNISPKGGLGNPGCHSEETKKKIGNSNREH